MKFSILVVSLNAGEKLKKTVDSILAQTCPDYEILVKDGCSSDHSVKQLPAAENLRLAVQADQGIYDAMNQAVEQARGEYVYFLNCGDYFMDEYVLERAAAFMDNEPGKDIYYGNIFDRRTQSLVASNPRMDAFACYRNVPCHQACFYRTELVKQHPFSLHYKVRADYEQFLWCYFEAGARMSYMGDAIASYEGNGFSETRENRRVSDEEHREITGMYMSGGQLFRYRAVMVLTLSGLRSALSHSPVFGRIYNRAKKALYRQSGRKEELKGETDESFMGM